MAAGIAGSSPQAGGKEQIGNGKSLKNLKVHPTPSDKPPLTRPYFLSQTVPPTRKQVIQRYELVGIFSFKSAQKDLEEIPKGV